MFALFDKKLNIYIYICLTGEWLKYVKYSPNLQKNECTLQFNIFKINCQIFQYNHMTKDQNLTFKNITQNINIMGITLVICISFKIIKYFHWNWKNQLFLNNEEDKTYDSVYQDPFTKQYLIFTIKYKYYVS